jgi:hypothetical protein
MCGPATIPITFACTPKWPSASMSCAATFSCASVSGRPASTADRRRIRGSGMIHSNAGSSVTDGR